MSRNSNGIYNFVKIGRPGVLAMYRTVRKTIRASDKTAIFALFFAKLKTIMCFSRQSELDSNYMFLSAIRIGM